MKRWPDYAASTHDHTVMASLADAQAIVNRGPAMMAVVWTLLSISTLVIIARLFVKFRALRRLFLDDWWILLAWVSRWLQSLALSIWLAH